MLKLADKEPKPIFVQCPMLLLRRGRVIDTACEVPSFAVPLAKRPMTLRKMIVQFIF